MRIGFLGNFRVPHSSESHHAATLEALGHEVVRLQENATDAGRIAEVGCASQLFVWIHTHGWTTPDMRLALDRIKAAGVPTMTYHLDLWRGLRRESDIRSSEYWDLDHFFTVDRLMADWLTANTPVRGHFLPAGVFAPDCYLTDQPSPHANDVVFVGSYRYHPEWPWRPQLIDFLKSTYRDRFTHIGPGGVTSLRGEDLNRLYSGSKVAVGDSLCQGFTYPWYTSDRLFEAPGRGGFQIFPNIVGVSEWIPDMPLFGFGDFPALKCLIDRYLDDTAERERLRLSVHEHVKTHHTYTQRWETILTELGF